MAAGGGIHKYPEIRTDDKVVDDYFGAKISDPYRWLENINSAEVKQFVKVQNQLTDEYLKKSDSISGNGEDAGGDGADSQIRELIRARLLDLWADCDYSCPFKRGDQYFFFENGALYSIKSIIENDDRDDKQSQRKEMACLVLDPNSAADGFLNQTFSSTSTNKTTVGLTLSSSSSTDENFGDRLISISDDGNVLAYGLSENGSVWSTIHFKNLATGTKYEKDVLKNVQDTYLSWTKDSKGLFYGRYPEKTLNYKNEKIFYHRVGTPQTADRLILEFSQNPNWELKPKVSDCGEYLIVYVLQDCGGHTKVCMSRIDEIMKYVESPNTKGKALPAFSSTVADFKWDYDYITNIKHIFYFRTNKNAPTYKVIKVDVTKSKEVAKRTWPCVVQHHKKNVLDWAICVNKHYLVTCYIQRVQSYLQLRKLKDGTILYQFPLEFGTISGHTGRSQDTNFFFKFSSFFTPGTIFRINLNCVGDLEWDEEDIENEKKRCPCCGPSKQEIKLPMNIFRNVNVPKSFDPNQYEVDQIMYTSHDGTKISMFLVHKKGLVKNGKNPCILLSYGGFNKSLLPEFDPTYLLFLTHFDGVFAVAQIRGGGEYGTNWYEEGIRLKKQNSISDFQFAARYLCRSKYTCPEKLTIRGSSNGGLVVAASINQKPELFGAAVVGFGVLDLLRFHKFSSGPCWISDYGSSENEQDFKNLLGISPVHNVAMPQKAQLPSTLLITSENDEVVVPMHSYKMIARLQSKVGSSPNQINPLLLRVLKNTGHGEGTFETSVEEIIDIITFMKTSLKLTFKE